MNENHSRTICNHFLASFLDDCARSGCEGGGHARRTTPTMRVSALIRMRRRLCMWWSECGSGSQLKVKAFGWWKTFGTLKQESACSSAQVGNRKRRPFEVLVSHTPRGETIAVFAGSHWSISLSVLYHCFLWNGIWNRSNSQHITQGEKQLGIEVYT